MQLSNGSRLSASAAVIGIMAVTLVLLLMRSSGIYPTVLGDEYTYSSMARVLPFSAAAIPNYLYLSIYKSTLLCGDGFMSCTKLLNAVFFVAAAPFIFWTARRVCSTRVSLLIVALGMLGPINSYTAYFMPESLFFLTFWISVCYFLTLDVRASMRHWLLFGVIMGCSSLVKPHALFVVPAFCLCIMFFAYKGVDDWFSTGLKSAVVFVVAMLLTKFGFSFLLAGKSGLTLFGNFYASTLESNTSSLQRYLAILSTSPKIALGHLLGNAVMFGCAVAIVLFGTFKALATKAIQADEKLAFCTLFLLLNLIAVVALFSASVAGSNAIETALRIHMRYYDFMFPLLFIAAGSQLKHIYPAPRSYVRAAVLIVVLAILAYAAITRLHPFTLSFIDNPELRGFTMNKSVFKGFAVLSAICLIVWFKSARWGAGLFLFAYLPLSIAVSTAYTTVAMRERLVPDAFDKAGLFARSYLPASEVSHLLVLGDNPASILRSLFWVENLNAGPDLSYVPGVPYTAAQSPTDKKWILAIGDVDFVKDDFNVMRFNGYSLARKVSLRFPWTVDLRNVLLPDSVESITGLSQVETWGTWSDAAEVVIEFVRPLPREFDLEIDAKAFGPNAGRAFDLEVAGRSVPVTLDAEMTSQTLRISNPSDAYKLVIKIPSPTSPEQLDMSTDKRLLGVGIHQLVIRPAK